MSSKRSWHTATRLLNGKVLVIGGYNGTDVLKSCELIDLANNGFSSIPADSLKVARNRHTATLLPDEGNGSALVCGGSNGTSTLDTCELYYV